MRKDIEIMFEGGAGMSIAAVDLASADALAEAYRRSLQGELVPFVELSIQQEDGAVTNFIIDVRRILTMSMTTA